MAVRKQQLKTPKDLFLEHMVAGLTTILLRLDILLRRELQIDAGPPRIAGNTVFRSLSSTWDKSQRWFDLKHKVCSKPGAKLLQCCEGVKCCMQSLPQLLCRPKPKYTRRQIPFRIACRDEYELLHECAVQAAQALSIVALHFPRIRRWPRVICLAKVSNAFRSCRPTRGA